MSASVLSTELLAMSGEMLLLVDGHSLAILEVSPAALQRLGYSRSTLLAMTVNDLECALADIFFWDELRSAASGAGEAAERQSESAYRCADGTVLDVFKTVRCISPSPLRYAVLAIPSAPQLQAQSDLADIDSRLRATLEATADGILLMDQQGAILNMNRRFSSMWQLPDDLLVNHDDAGILEFIAAQCLRRTPLDEAGSAVETGHADEEANSLELLELRDGRSFECASHVARTRKGVIGRVYSYRDITERKQAEARLQLAASVFTHAREGIMITAPDGSITEVNDTFTEITGYSRNEVLGQSTRMLSSGRQGAEFYARMWRDLAEQGYWSGEIWNRRKNGEVYAQTLTISAVYDAQQQIQRYVALFSDITAVKKHQQYLEHIAHFDALTGLPNRVLLADRLHQAMAHVERRNQQLAVAYLDLDGFKAINDNHGHEVGDELLIAVAGQMRQALREGDTIARLGGDEFVAVLTDLDSAEACEPVLERLLAAAARPVRIGDLVLRVSASLGVTFCPQLSAVDADQLLRQADQAMYQAKLAGKNRYHLFDAVLDQAVKGYHESLERLREALAAGEFVLHYQPKVDMRLGTVVGLEALIRWQHPEQGLLAPARFLPMTENHPISIDIGDWVIHQALQQMADWQAEGLDLPVSVNVGALQLQQADFVRKLQHHLAAFPQVKAERLMLEVLETSALEDIAQVSGIMRACCELGVSFSLDDFGTGYSSLTYLKRLPVSQIKIDQSFVRDMLDDPDDLAILEGVLGLAAAFGREVIAEGVETAAHAELLLLLGCPLAQGYGIARPLPAAAVADWVRSWQPLAAWAQLPAADRRDLPLLFAMVEIRAWVHGIEACLSGDRITPPPIETHRCHFGSWLGSDEGQRYATRPEFAHIDRLHRAVHAAGSAVLAYKAAQQLAAAGEQMDRLYLHRDHLLAQVMQLLRGANDEVC